uniref:Transposase n=1 Tax=Romanomermis culicivorax TaxID=13658 RepID=A0A915I3A2_ROMCU
MPRALARDFTLTLARHLARDLLQRINCPDLSSNHSLPAKLAAQMIHVQWWLKIEHAFGKILAIIYLAVSSNTVRDKSSKK